MRRARPVMLWVAIVGVAAGAGPGAAGCGPRARPAPPAGEARIEAELRAARAEVEARPDSVDAWRELALLSWMAGDRGRAAEALNELDRRRPSDARGWLARAMIDELGGREEAAVDTYVALVELARRAQDPWLHAAALYAISRLGAAGQAGGREAAREALWRVADGGGPAPLAAAALDALGAWTARDPDPAAEERRARRRGCVRGWAMRGVADPAPHVAFLAREPLPERHDGGWVADAGCRIAVRAPARRAARVRLSTWIESGEDRELEVELRVADPDVLARLSVEGGEVIGRDTARRFLPATMTARFRLGRGVSELALDLAMLGGETAVEVVLRDPDTGAAPARLEILPGTRPRPAGPNGLPGEFVAARPAFVPPAAPRFADGLLVDVLFARAALDRRDTDAAGEAIARVREAAPRWPTALVLEAELALVTPARPRALAVDEARRRLGRALAIDPGAVAARLALAALRLEKGDPAAALATLGDDGEGPRLAHARADLLRWRALEARGLQAEAEAALALAAKARPDDCEVREALLRVADRRGQLPARRRAAADLVACDGDSAALALVARDAGDHDTEVAERRRLWARAPGDPLRAVDLARALLGAGRRAEAAAALDRASDEEDAVVVARADVRAAGGDAASARRLIEDGLRRRPWARDLASALVALGGRDPIDAWRVDGLEAIRAFEADERAGRRRPYDAPAVLVLDRMVVLVWPDGSRISITHTITKVLEKEGLERFGELEVPGRAELLRARTIKADGTTREPEQLGVKQGLTAPDLAVGDYVEVEYVTADRASHAFPGGFQGDRFYFSSFEAPLDRTELIVAAPPAYPLEWDLRGDAPAPQVAERDGWRVTTLQARGRPKVVGEPLGPPASELLASARPFAGVTAERWRRWVAQQAYGLRRGDRDLGLAAERATAGARTPETRARAVYDYVMERIEDGGGLADEPAQVLARRTGRRAVLFAAMCEAAGLPVELLLARPRTSGEGAPPAGAVDEMAYPLVRVRLPDRAVLVDVRHRHAPFGYLMPSLRGAPALVVPDPERAPRAWAQAPRVERLPHDTRPPDVRDVELDVALRSDGGATIEVRETLTGATAMGWREYLEDVPADELAHDLEQRALGDYFPGVTLESVAFEDREDHEAPLVARYRFDAPRVARPAPGGGLAIPVQLLPFQLGRRYVLVSRRSMPLVLDVAPRATVRLRVRLPAGWAIDGEPLATLALTAPDGAGGFRHEMAVSAGGFTSVVVLELASLARIAPASYEAFVRFAGAVDAREAAVVVARPGAGAASGGP